MNRTYKEVRIFAPCHKWDDRFSGNMNLFTAYRGGKRKKATMIPRVVVNDLSIPTSRSNFYSRGYLRNSAYKREPA